MLVGVSPILTLKVRSEQNESARRQCFIKRRNLDVENIKEGSVKSWVTWVPTLRVSEVYDFANPIHWRVVHLRFLNGSSLANIIRVTLIFNVESPDEQVILRPVSMHRVMFSCTSKFHINGFIRKKSVVMENSFCFNPKIFNLSLWRNKICCPYFNPSMVD